LREDKASNGKDESLDRSEMTGFPIVGIGASAGGLEAIQKFFTNMPSDSGMAFVVVQHLDPTHESMLSELVSKHTQMEVSQVRDGQDVEKDKVYIIPPNYDMALMHGKLHLMRPNAPRGMRLPIDYFFRSLAQDQRERSICIVLSGTGTDGSLGLKVIKGEGGMCMAQDPESAKYDGMPRSAISTGLVDYVIPPEEMPENLIEYVKHAFAKDSEEDRISITTESQDLQKIFMLLRSQTGHDFTHYKKNTIVRRIERRMTLHKITYLSDYVDHLRRHPLELETLFKDLLIGVTNFFRDPEAFESLREQVIKPLIMKAEPKTPVRVWIPGCSTGEEVYTIGILFYEEMENAGKNLKLQIFGTDIDKDAIESARRGQYPDNIAGDVPENYLRKYFERQDSAFVLSKRIKDVIVFAPQNVIDDPPFSKIDLIVCRNLLIYMGPELQKQLIPLFHYALKPEGFLFLGTSESIGHFTKLYEVKDRKWKIFQKADIPDFQGPRLNLNFPPFHSPKVDRSTPPHHQEAHQPNYKEIIQKALMNSFSPPAALINRDCDILYLSGATDHVLRPPEGVPKLNLLSMARKNLRLELTSCVRRAISQNETCKLEGLRINNNGSDQLINVHVIPVLKPPSMRGLFVVAFENVQRRANDLDQPLPDATYPQDERERKRTEQLEHELASTREYLQTTIEELETSNEELKSTNEELQSSNEEMQSANEELQTSKEELQSMNEELTTVNTELENKIEELSRANDDVNNLMASSQVGVAFFDSDLNLIRFTSAVTSVLNVLPSDIGRPLNHLTTNMDYDNLAHDVEETIRSLEEKELNVKAENGRWYLLRIAPYKTSENTFEGVVLTFIDCTEQKEAEIELANHREQLELTMWGADLGLWDLYIQTGEVYFNDQWAESLGYKPDELAHTVQTWQGMVHEDDLPSTIKDWNAHINGETPIFESRYRLKTSSGDWKWTMARGKVSSRDQEGNAIRAAGVFLDLSASISAKDAQMRTVSHIEQKTEILKEALSISPDHFHLYDLNGRCLYANDSALKALDLKSDQFVGMTVWELGDKIDVLKSFDRRLDEVVESEDSIEGETYYRIDGEVEKYLYIFKPIRDQERSIVSVLAAYRNA
jgi:two-component system CheB/CheR fusion protein